ncbi:unnamed protein product [Diamesa hyperborea]
MKIFIALFALVALASAEFQIKTSEDLQKYRGECVQELEIPAETVEEYKKWNFKPEGKTPCYIRCIFTKMEIFNDEVGPIVDNLVLQLGQGRTDDIKDDIEKCIDNSGDDKCMWAFKGFGCFKKSNLSLIQQSVKKV